jgi:hypothetical protein
MRRGRQPLSIGFSRAFPKTEKQNARREARALRHYADVF